MKNIQKVVGLESGRSERTPRRLRTVMGDEVQELVYQDEVVEGLLPATGLSFIYGSPNVGKTFLAIDLAAAISLGKQWMGRRTEPGLVVYIAAESQDSVLARIAAYERYHGVALRHVCIVTERINLFANSVDAQAIVDEIEALEEIYKPLKVRMVIGDTFARLMTGANENSNDVDQVLVNVDYIRLKARTHFLLVAHPGKDQKSGIRGWSGVLGAADGELIVHRDKRTGHGYVQVTKARDLGIGDRFGFQLKVVKMGRKNNFGIEATSCVIQADEAPLPMNTQMQRSGVVREILKELERAGEGIKKSALARKLCEESGIKTKNGKDRQYSVVHRELRPLQREGIISIDEVTTLVKLVKHAPCS
jgi:putative DNA primase/helicase